MAASKATYLAICIVGAMFFPVIALAATMGYTSLVLIRLVFQTVSSLFGPDELAA